MKAENVIIPDEIKGVKLTEQEKNDLKEGKAVFLEGMKSQAANDFDAKVQISAERRGIEYIFENDRVFNRQELGGVKLTKQQVEDLNLGKAIFVEDMKRKDGEYFSSFVKLDPQSGRPAYMRYNPDSPEGDREIYIPKKINGVKLTGEEREELRAGRGLVTDIAAAKQLKIIDDVFSKCDSIIVATDAGREGELIFRCCRLNGTPLNRRHS